MRSCPIPLTAVVKGHAIGAGKTLMAACDYRFAATGRVLVGVPEILLGVPNPFFADQLLRFLVGDGLASDLIYSGKLVAAETLVACGLVNQVFPKETVEDEAWKKTRGLAVAAAGFRRKQVHAHGRTLRAHPRRSASAYGCPDDGLDQ
jgi:enoyl-CoA hydratase